MFTFIDMGIMIEQRSSNRRGMTSSSYQGPSFGYWTYHCYKSKSTKCGIVHYRRQKHQVYTLLMKQTFLASVSFQTFPDMPRTITTTIWKTNTAPVNLSIIASTAVSFGSGTPLLMPSLVSLPTNKWGMVIKIINSINK